MCYHKGSADRSGGLEICKAIVESWQAEVDAGRRVANDRALDALLRLANENERLRTALQQIDEGHCLCPDKHDRSECLCWLWISQAALAEPVSQSAESEEPIP